MDHRVRAERNVRLIVISGLPGSGKSTIAEGVARALGAAILSIDPIEAAMWRSGLLPTQTGIAAYQVAAALAAENLRRGLTVVIDAVNPVEAARQGWRAIAAREAVALSFVECACSDLAVHRDRIEKRVRGIEGMPEVTWDRVQERRAEYEPWGDRRILLETATERPEVLIETVISQLL